MLLGLKLLAVLCSGSISNFQGPIGDGIPPPGGGIGGGGGLQPQVKVTISQKLKPLAYSASQTNYFTSTQGTLFTTFNCTCTVTGLSSGSTVSGYKWTGEATATGGLPPTDVPYIPL